MTVTNITAIMVTGAGIAMIFLRALGKVGAEEAATALSSLSVLSGGVLFWAKDRNQK